MVTYIIEATVIPTTLFYVFVITFELKWAIVAALGWTYAAMGRRIVTDRRSPTCWCSPRWGSRCAPSSTCSVATNSTTFFQPIMRTVATAAAFAPSVRIGPPLIARFAADFCPLGPDLQIRPAVVQRRRLPYLW